MVAKQMETVTAAAISEGLRLATAAGFGVAVVTIAPEGRACVRLVAGGPTCESRIEINRVCPLEKVLTAIEDGVRLLG